MVNGMRNKFAAVPPVKGGDEKLFIKQYLQAREDWLKSSSNELVRRTTYRMDAFQDLVALGNWDLKTPFIVRKVTVS
jgi:chitosanase